MSSLTKLQIALVLLLTAGATGFATHVSSGPWLPFWLLLLAVSLSSGFKVALPRGDGSMSLNYPFILLGILQLSPVQAMLLAAVSVAVQCRIRIVKAFTFLQILFNVANAMLATFCALEVSSALQHAGMALAPALAVGSVAYFFTNTFAVALVLASSGSSKLSALSIWRAEYPWYLPFYLVGALLAATVHWMSLRFGWSTALLLIPVVYILYRAYTSQFTRMLERQQHFEETEALHLRTIEGLAMAIEAKDQGTHDHLFRVRHYVREVAQTLQLSKLEMQALETAAFLHDIGKLAVPEHIINKPGKLTPEEFEKMKIHPVVGADILERVRFPYPVVPIVRSHHEWWNGKGYPDGLSGTAIPIGARILTIVDCFDALVSDRPYRKGMGSTRALEIIRELSGKQFDPEIVSIFEICHAQAENKAQSLVPAGFTPLNTEIEVWRGLAPGAGFAAGSDVTAHATVPSLSGAADPAASTVAAQSLEALTAAATSEAQSLADLSQRLGSPMSPAEFVALTATRLRRLVHFDTCALYLREDDLLRACFIDGEYAGHFTDVPIPLGEGISGWAAQNTRPLCNGNASVEPGSPVLPNGAPALRSGTALPLLDAGKQAFAVLTLYSVHEDAFSEYDVHVLTAMGPQLALILQRSLHRPQTHPRPERDALLGLPDAGHLFVQLEKQLALSEETQRNFAVLVCALDHFDSPNERRAAGGGENSAWAIANALQQLCRPSEFVAGLSGGEFVFLLPAIDKAGLEGRIAAIRAVVTSRRHRPSQASCLSIAVGAATYPWDGFTAETLLSAAGKRMHRDRHEPDRQHTAALATEQAATVAR